MRILLTLLLLLTALPTHAETAYARVQRTGVIRCGYIVWPPYLDKDPNTKKLTGMDYEFVNALAKSLSLKVDWAEEITPGQQIESLRSGKIDAICSAEGPMVQSTARYLYYSNPIIHLPVYLYARANDKRFDNNPSAINNPNVRIAIIDGDISDALANAQFPKAGRHSIPQIAAPSQVMMDVASGKADIVINDPVTMRAYFKTNPNKLRKIELKSLDVNLPNTLSILQAPEGLELLTLLNQGIDNLHNYGIDTQIFTRYPDYKF